MDKRKNIQEASTKELVNELSKREGVKIDIADPFKNKELKVNGPAIILTVID